MNQENNKNQQPSAAPEVNQNPSTPYTDFMKEVAKIRKEKFPDCVMLLFASDKQEPGDDTHIYASIPKKPEVVGQLLGAFMDSYNTDMLHTLLVALDAFIVQRFGTDAANEFSMFMTMLLTRDQVAAVEARKAETTTDEK